MKQERSVDDAKGDENVAAARARSETAQGYQGAGLAHRQVHLLGQTLLKTSNNLRVHAAVMIFGYFLHAITHAVW